jgi:Tryptophan-rich sensory protein (mitochondrial benzodiazepine receptor homolog)
MKFSVFILFLLPINLHGFTTNGNTITTRSSNAAGTWMTPTSRHYHHHRGGNGSRQQQDYDSTKDTNRNGPVPTLALAGQQSSFRQTFQRGRKGHGRYNGMHLGMTSSSRSASSDTQKLQELDTGAIAKYLIALVTQMSLISGFFYTLDTILPMVTTGADTLPTAITWIMCYLFSLKSRVFNPLNNARPDRQKAIEEGQSDGFKDRNQPSWTPPGVVFPIMWLLIIGPLRATSSTLIVNSMHGYLTLPLMSLMLHLSCGDIWNTINNTEKRYGTSVLGIVFVYISALHAAWRYSQVDPLAGKLLGATAIWLTIAGTLIAEIWRLNPDETTGERESLLPMKNVGEDSVTTFAWKKMMMTGKE